MGIESLPVRQSEALDVLRTYTQNMLRAEMRRKKVTYRELSTRLAGIGIQVTVNTLIKKINRSEFPAHFLIACLSVLDVQALDISDLDVTGEIRRRYRFAGKS